jgi:hypothetical protein
LFDHRRRKEISMRRLIPASLMVVALAATILLAASPDPTPGRPQYAGDNKLLRPADYREWIFLSSGFGMSYCAQAGHEMFTNVRSARAADRILYLKNSAMLAADCALPG